MRETWRIIVGSAQPAGHRPLFAERTGRRVGWVHWGEDPADPGPLSLDEVRGRLGPGDRFDDPETPNRNRCEAGHWFDEVLAGGCPWCA